MKANRFALLVVVAMYFSAAYAQKPGPEFWRRVGCTPFEPRTRLEAMELKPETVLIKGFTRITTVEIRGVRVDAIELRELKSGERVKGIVVSLRESAEPRDEDRAYIDYNEIDPFVAGIDAASGVNETATRLVNFEARYRTVGDLELIVFRQTRTGSAVTLATGICNQVIQTLTLDDLAKFRAMIVEAKSRLDEIK